MCVELHQQLTIFLMFASVEHFSVEIHGNVKRLIESRLQEVLGCAMCRYMVVYH